MRGTDQFIGRLNSLSQAIRDELKEEIEATATDIEIGAIRMAPTSIGQKIQKVAAEGGLVQRISVNAGAIGAYTEFGTGQSAAALVPTLPDEWQSVARQFFINGQGKLRSAPYLYPNWVRYTTGLKDRLKLILDRAVR